MALVDYESLAALAGDLLEQAGEGLSIRIKHGSQVYDARGVRQGMSTGRSTAPASSISGVLIEAKDFWVTAAADGYAGPTPRIGDQISLNNGPWFPIAWAQAVQPAGTPLVFNILVRG